MTTIRSIEGHEVEISILAGVNGWVWKATSTDEQVGFEMRGKRGFGSIAAAFGNAVSSLERILA